MPKPACGIYVGYGRMIIGRGRWIQEGNAKAWNDTLRCKLAKKAYQTGQQDILHGIAIFYQRTGKVCTGRCNLRKHLHRIRGQQKSIMKDNGQRRPKTVEHILLEPEALGKTRLHRWWPVRR